RRCGVQAHQLEPDHAQMSAGDRPIGQAGCAQRTPIADAVLQDAPRERQLVAVLPHGARHLDVVMRLLPSDAENRHQDVRSREPRQTMTLGMMVLTNISAAIACSAWS